jgi:hypothetical protein
MRRPKSQQLNLSTTLAQPEEVLCHGYDERSQWFARADQFEKVEGKWRLARLGEFWIRSWEEKADRRWLLKLVWH